MEAWVMGPRMMGAWARTVSEGLPAGRAAFRLRERPPHSDVFYLQASGSRR